MTNLATIMIGAFVAILLGVLIWSPGGPWLPTSKKDIRTMLQMAALQPGETFYDLGCGNGRALVIAAKEFGAKAIGIEIDPLRYQWSKITIWLNGLTGQVELRNENFLSSDLQEANVILLFILQKTSNKLAIRLATTLPPGVRIVSSMFILPGWKIVSKNEKEQIYLYIKE